MKKLTFLAFVIISSLNPAEAFAQLTLTCPTSGSLTLINEYQLSSTGNPAQCSFVVDNTVTSIGATISLSNAVLTAISGSAQSDPVGTTTTAQLSYNNNSANKLVNQNASISDTFLGARTYPMSVAMQTSRTQKFSAGSYTYGVTINITAP